MRKRKILVTFGLLACMAAGTVFHGMTGFVHAEESTLEMVDLADGVTYGCNEQGMPQFVNLNGNSVIIKDVPAEEGGTVKYHNIYIDKNRNGIVDDGEEKVVLDKDMGGSDNSDVPAGIPIYGIYQAKSTTPIRITLEGNGYGTVIGVNQGELVTSEGTAVFMDIDCGSIGECYAAKSSTVTVSGTVEKAIAVHMVNGNISALYGVQDCTVITGENVNTGIALEMTGGTVSSCYVDQCSDVAMASNIKMALDVDILQDAAVSKELYAVSGDTGLNAEATEITGAVDINIDGSGRQVSGSLSVSTLYAVRNNITIDGSLTVMADNMSSGPVFIAQNNVIITEDMSVVLGENASIYQFYVLENASVDKDVTVQMCGSQYSSMPNQAHIVKSKAASKNYTIGGDLTVIQMTGHWKQLFCVEENTNVNGDVTVSIEGGSLESLTGMQDATVGGDFRLTTGETVEFTGGGYIYGCRGTVNGNFEFSIYNANTMAQNYTYLYPFNYGPTKIGGDVIITEVGGYYSGLNYNSTSSNSRPKVAGDYTLTIKGVREYDKLYGVHSIEVEGNVSITLQDADAASNSNGCAYMVKDAVCKQNVEITTKNNQFTSFEGVSNAEVTGNVTLQCSGDTASLSSGGYFYGMKMGKTAGSVTAQITNCQYKYFYGFYTVSEIGGAVDMRINGGNYISKIEPCYESNAKDNITLVVDGAVLGKDGNTINLTNPAAKDTYVVFDVKDTCTVNGNYYVENKPTVSPNKGGNMLAIGGDYYFTGFYPITENVAAGSIYLSNGAIMKIPEGITISVEDSGMIYAQDGTQFLIEGTLRGAVCQDNGYKVSSYYVNGGELDTPTDNISYLYYPITLDYLEEMGTVTAGGNVNGTSLCPELLFGRVGHPMSVTCKAKKGYELTSVEIKKLSGESPSDMAEDETTAGKYSFTMPKEPVSISVGFAAAQITLGSTKCDIETEFNKTSTLESPLYDMADIEITNDAEEGTVSYEVDGEYGLPTGLRLKNGKIYGTPARVYEDGKTTVIHITGKNGTTADFTLNFTVQQGGSGLDKIEVAMVGLPIELTAEYGNRLSEIDLPYNENGVWYLGGKEIANPSVSADDLPDGAFVWKDADTVVDALEGEEAVYFVTYVPEDSDCYEIMPTQLQVSVKVIHIHRYGDTWEKDADNHWKECKCGERAEEAAHTWDAGVVTKQPTATEAGERTLTCTVCEATKIVEEPATGEKPHEHIYSDAWKTDADNHWKECECGEKAEEAAHTWDAGVVTKQPTATEAGERTQTCTVCKAAKIVEEPATGGEHKHVYGDTWKTDTNKHWKECECGDRAEEAAHVWDAGVVTKQPTAAQTGEKTLTCTVCKKTKTETVAVLGGNENPGGDTPGGVTPGGNENQEGVINVPAEGTVLTDSVTKAKYKVTGTEEGSRTVMYMVTTNKAAATVNIPSVVMIDNISYDVTAIADNAFKNNKKLKKVVISSKILTIGNAAFSGCKKLATVTMGANVTTIGKNAFYNCIALKKIVIPKAVVKIGSKAFYGCKKLLNITIKTTKLTTKNVGSKAFTKAGSSNYKKMVVKVPKSKLKAYKKTLKKRGVNSKAKIKK
ncbi:MAG: leucine-rich repeat domain-containing protein [Lachnospiraceae bacterium]|nr:leucine-rich repeat domain-containing protein [Lachnospiraceae bacterium]